MWLLARRVCPYSSIFAAPATATENRSPQRSSPLPMNSPPPPTSSWKSPKARRSCSFADTATSLASSPPPASTVPQTKISSADLLFSAASRTSSSAGTAERRLPNSRSREGNCRHLFEESFHPADDPVPRLLQLLHVSKRSRPARRALHDPGRGARARQTRPPRRMQGSALQPRG